MTSKNACQWKSAHCSLNPSHLENFLNHIFKMGVNRNLILDGTENLAGAEVMPFHLAIGSLGETLFFQMGLRIPLQTM